ncbi:branched-chain amino acid ABC transporter permease [Vulcanibacillus modesticaldus]|uniref:Branched-chain amino acid ABC transporter permease n=2 Tax=Vulcanibacillus modesticaldus TaxID=337097 RepID=A0A1D2YTT5_9BACI|nr:branched-chain amino acid ABC transporter permease [Vulcanibacillus modesticaldus]
MIAGIPIAIGYIPIAITFGLLTKTVELPNYLGIVMSLLIFAGASQFVGVNLIAIGATYWEIVLTTFILNFRHFLLSASISQRIERNTSKNILAILSFGITDETSMVASLREENEISPNFLFGLNLTAFTSWNIGTLAGIFLGAGLPDSIQSSMGIALYSMFIGLLIPSIKKSNPILIISLLAAVINSILFYTPMPFGISTGWRIIISTILASIIGTVIFPTEGQQK